MGENGDGRDEDDVGQSVDKKGQSLSNLENPRVSRPGLPRTKSPGAGKPIVKQTPASPQEVRDLLFLVLDKETAEKMIRSLRKKIGRGNISALEFLFDRVIGRPAVQVQVGADAALTQFMDSWHALLETAQYGDVPRAISAPATIDAEYRDITPSESENNSSNGPIAST